MMAQVTAAALVSESKVLCASRLRRLDPDLGREGGPRLDVSHRRPQARAVVGNLERVLAIELIAAFQAMEFLLPLTTSSAALERVRREFRRVVRAWTATGSSTPTWNGPGFLRAGEARAIRPSRHCRDAEAPQPA